MNIFDVAALVAILLTFTQSVHSKQELLCPEVLKIGKDIAHKINYHFTDKQDKQAFKFINNSCNAILCSGNTTLGSVSISVNIDYCSLAIRLKVDVSRVQVINVTLHNNTYVFAFNKPIPTNVTIKSKILTVGGKLNISIETKVIQFDNMGQETKSFPISGSINNICSKTPTAKPTTVLTTKPLTETTGIKQGTSPMVTTAYSTQKSSSKGSSMEKPIVSSTPVTTITKVSTAKSSSQKSTTKKLTTSKPTTKSIPTTNKPITKHVTKAPSTQRNTVTKPQTEKKTTQKIAKPTTKELLKPTRGHKRHHSRTTKAILLVLAIVILIFVIGLVIYCRKKKRLSNLPAYYNDIVINDPLKMDTESDLGNGNEVDDINDDGDELPLFS